jgi:hypothetical protein
MGSSNNIDRNGKEIFTRLLYKISTTSILQDDGRVKSFIFVVFYLFIIFVIIRYRRQKETRKGGKFKLVGAWNDGVRFREGRALTLVFLK